MALFLALSLTPLAIVGYIAYNDRESYLKEDIGSDLESNAKNILTILNSLLANEKQKIEELASTVSFQRKIANGSAPKVTEALKKFNKKNKHYSGVYFLSNKGIILASSKPDKVDHDLSNEKWFKRAIQNHTIKFQNLRKSTLTGNSVLSITIPLVSSNDKKHVVVKGYILAEMAWKYTIGAIFSSQNNGEGSQKSLDFKLINKKGSIISSSNIRKENQSGRGGSVEYFNFSDLEKANKSFKNRKGFFIAKDSSGNKNLVGFSYPQGFQNLKDFGWTSLVHQDVQTAFKPVIELRNEFVILGFGVCILSLFFSIVVSRKFSIPIQEITGVAGEIAKGNLSQKIEINLQDEIGDLAKAINSMSSDLENSRKELICAKEEAEEASRAKSEFLSRMSHELRTPLNAILGFGQILKIDKKTPLTGIQNGQVEEILKGGKHLLALINEVLDLARIESGKFDLSIKAICLSDVVNEMLTLIVPLAEKKGIEVKNKISQSPHLYILADRTRMKQVLLNLMSNAIKYNREGGSVTLESNKHQEGKIHITVADTGKGIPGDRLKDLFKPFNRLGAEKTEVEGTGIGLSLTKNLVENMAGTISVESQPGIGSCFSIELPESKMPEGLEDGSSVSSILSLEKKTDGKITLLYVEDNSANLRLVQQILSEREDIHLLSAPEAQLGLDLARAHRPDLILMDINLPGMDGLTAMKHLKTNEETQGIPVIAVSANAMESDIDSAMKAGFDSYITKPIEVDHFLRTLNSFLTQGSLT
jgi:signal transduction histidine kinase/CheY-like chemotaxis protein